MDVIQRVSQNPSVSQDPFRFIFWLFLMLAVLGIMGRIVYAAWRSGGQPGRRGQDSDVGAGPDQEDD
jgi:hypothetical protein